VHNKEEDKHSGRVFLNAVTRGFWARFPSGHRCTRVSSFLCCVGRSKTQKRAPKNNLQTPWPQSAYACNSCVRIQLKRNDLSRSAANRPQLQLHENNQMPIGSINRRGYHSAGSWQSSGKNRTRCAIHTHSTSEIWE
jgi:hypothetical protein